MTPEERERLNWLCKRIQEEQDAKKCSNLIADLNELLEAKEHRLDQNQNRYSD